MKKYGKKVRGKDSLVGRNLQLPVAYVRTRGNSSTGNVISGQNTWKNGRKPQLPIGHARTLPSLRGHVTETCTNILYYSSKKKNAGKIRGCARDHFRDFRSLPVTSGHVTSGSSTTSLHHLKYDLSCTHILLSRENMPLFLPLNAACIAEKQQKPFT